jgi:general secretion pathway protein C
MQTLINLLTLSAALYLGVDIGYRGLRYEVWRVPIANQIGAEAGAESSRFEPGRADASIVIRRNLFGVSLQDTTQNTLESLEALEPTSLKIRLLGTATGPRASSFAVIEEKDKRKQGLYRVGDSIQNARVKRILSGKVVLRVAGHDEILAIREPQTKPSPALPAPLKTAATETNVTVKRSVLSGSLENMNQLLREVRIRPRFKDGKDDGYRVLWIKPNSFFLDLGLRDGDVIKGVNHQEVETTEDLLALYRDLKAGTPISLQLERRGKAKTINYRFR